MALYAKAEVEDAVDSARWCCRGESMAFVVRGRIARVGRAKMAFREAMMERGEASQGFWSID
jgi:hypothetical protein